MNAVEGWKTVFCFVWLAGFAAIYYYSRKKYVSYSGALTIYKFQLALFAPIGFLIIKHLPYKFTSKYDRQIRVDLAELYGRRESGAYFHIHNAQRAVMIITVVFFCGLIALLGEVDLSFYVIVAVIALFMPYWVDQQLDVKLQARKKEILLDLPEFINKLVLLINAGLTFSAAVQRVVKEQDAARPLYRELQLVVAEQRGGKSVYQVYEDFAQRCRVPEVTRLVSSILQNVSRGNTDLSYVLRNLAQEAWERRKELAKKQGEEASSKLIFPMVMVFIAVAIIVLAPAVISMSR